MINYVESNLEFWSNLIKNRQLKDNLSSLIWHKWGYVLFLVHYSSIYLSIDHWSMNYIRSCITLFINPPTEWGGHYKNALCPSVSLFVHNISWSRAVTYVCIDGLPSNLVQMLSSLRQCAVTVTRIHTSKVKVTQDI